jgi:arginase
MKPQDLTKHRRREDDAKVVCIGVPWDTHSSFERGAAAAPEKIARLIFHDAQNSWSELGIDLMAPGHFRYAGTLDLDNGGTLDDEQAFRLIEETGEIIASGANFPIFLGGDHAVTYPLIRGLTRSWKTLNILHVDAHPDLYDDYGGDKWSHASPFARIMEEGLVGNLLQIGIRTLNDHQRDQAKRFGVKMIEMKDWKATSLAKLEGPIYLSIDLDGLDPAFAPGVSHKEPGGLSTREVIDIIHQLKGKLIGADVVEYNPRFDLSDQTAIVAAKLVKEIAGTMLSAK